MQSLSFDVLAFDSFAAVALRSLLDKSIIASYQASEQATEAGKIAAMTYNIAGAMMQERERYLRIIATVQTAEKREGDNEKA
jgi:hypothetical protein